MKYEVGDELRVYNGHEWYDFVLYDIEDERYLFHVTPDRLGSTHTETWSDRKFETVLNDGWKIKKAYTEQEKAIKKNYNI